MINVNNSILSNTSIIYALVWIPLVALSRLDLFIFSTRGDFLIELYVAFLVLSFILIYFFVHLIFSTRANPRKAGINELEFYALRLFVIRIFKIWFIGFSLNILYSGGLPVIWVLLGEDRTYSNFGMPTFSGLLNMVRMFMLISIVICNTNKIKVPNYILIIIILSLGAELNRAAILYGILVSISSFLLFNKLKIKNLMKLFGGFVSFIIIFTFIAQFREAGTGNYSSPDDYFNTDVAIFGAMPYLILYYLSPLNNLYYQYSLGFEPTFTPYFTFQSILPTVIRDYIFTGDTVYSVTFASEVFNTSPYLANIIADFGMVGAFIVILIMQFIFCYVFLRASRNSLSHCLMHSMIWGATALSCFTNLYFSLVMLLFPILILIFNRFKKRHYLNHTCN